MGKISNEDLRENKKLGNVCARIIFFMTMLLLPVYMNSGYYTNTSKTKAYCFWFIAGAGIFLIILTLVHAFACGRYSGLKLRDFHFNLMDLAVGLLALSVIMAFIFTDDKKACFWGTDGFMVGTFSWLMLFVFYFFISRKLYFEAKIFDWVFVLNDVLYFMIFLNAVSVDILNMHGMIVEEQKFGYFSTLGQVDCCTAYLCVLVPLATVLYLNTEKTAGKVFYGINVALGIMGIICIRTNGVYLGLIFMALFFIPYVLSSAKRFKNLMEVGLLTALDLFILDLFYWFAKDRLDTTGGISMFLIDHYMFIPIALVCLCLWLIFRFAVLKHDTSKIEKAGFGVGIAASVLDFAAIIIYVIHSARHFDMNWGHYRGGVWEGSFRSYTEFPLVQKIFGCGADMLKSKISENVNAILNWGVQTATSHDSVLQVLLSVGIFGLICWLFAWFTVLKPYFRKGSYSWSPVRMGCYMGLAAYLGQSFVGNPYSLSVPIMMFIFTIYRATFVGNNSDELLTPKELKNKRKNR